MSDVQERLRRHREAGHVRRCHTLVTIGDHYNVAYHSWQATTLLLLLYPGVPDIVLIHAVMFHDVAERYCGDVPAPAKWDDATFASYYENLESRVFRDAFGHELPLTPQQRAWLKGVDMLEFYLYAEDQLAMGNRHMEKAHHNICTAIEEMAHALPPEIITFYNDHEWSRGNDRLP